ncbi:cupin domain-containing protein [bacterium]|nr:cupin domain-containing protein [bacterium]
MDAVNEDRVWDFGPLGMKWEITKSTADTSGEFFEAINVLAPEFESPPLHIHPAAEEVYEVVAGTLDVCVGGQWRKLEAGESATVPPGTPHTLKNGSGAEVRLINVHRPAQQFEQFFGGLRRLAVSGSVTFPPKGLRSVILLSMLFCKYPQEIISVKPPRWLMSFMARFGRLLGFKLPADESSDKT